MLETATRIAHSLNALCRGLYVVFPPAKTATLRHVPAMHRRIVGCGAWMCMPVMASFILGTLIANRFCFIFLRIFPFSASLAWLLPQPGFVLHLGPLMPCQVTFWRWVASFECRLHANDAVVDLYVGHVCSLLINSSGQDSAEHQLSLTWSLCLTKRGYPTALA